MDRERTSRRLRIGEKLEIEYLLLIKSGIARLEERLDRVDRRLAELGPGP
jgi:hypothetical protein